MAKPYTGSYYTYYLDGRRSEKDFDTKTPSTYSIKCQKNCGETYAPFSDNRGTKYMTHSLPFITKYTKTSQEILPSPSIQC